MKQSEKRLAVLAFVVLSLIGGLILSQRLLTWQRGLDRDEASLVDEAEASKSLLREMPLWTARGEWLTLHQPVAKSDLDADNESFQQLVARAQSAGLTIEQKQYQEPVKNEYYHQFGGTFTVKGDLPNVFRWIYSVQSPTEFRVIPQLKIIPDKEDASKVVCSMQCWRWYQPTLAQGN